MTARISIAVVLVILTAFSMPAPLPGQNQAYRATVRWTSYGIPHIRADDWGGLGYGIAHALAEAAFCVFALEVVRVNGELSRWFGPDGEELYARWFARPGVTHLASDVVLRAVLDDAAVARYEAAQSDEHRALTAGYVAGYNDWLAANRAELPASCADADWVRPITAADLARITMAYGVRFGVGASYEAIVRAAPPGEEGTGVDAARRGGAAAMLDRGRRSRADGRHDLAHGGSADPALDPGREGGWQAILGPEPAPLAGGAAGSNALAFGGAVTGNGRGLLLGNPHYFWDGPLRFHIRHLTIPGELDVMGGGAIAALPIVIGFNRHVAWSHTISPAARATIHRLELVDGDPLAYRYGDEVRRLEPREVTVPVLGEEGDLREEHRTV